MTKLMVDADGHLVVDASGPVSRCANGHEVRWPASWSAGGREHHFCNVCHAEWLAAQFPCTITYEAPKNT